MFINKVKIRVKRINFEIFSNNALCCFSIAVESHENGGDVGAYILTASPK
jgi:hypothetical protein